MKAVCFLILPIGVLIPADGPVKDHPSKGDIDKLRGAWLTVSLVHNRKTHTDDNTLPKPGPTTRVAYEGNKWMIRVGDKTVAGVARSVDADADARRRRFCGIGL